MSAPYHVEVEPAVDRTLGKLTPEIRTRILVRIQGLGNDPRPWGCVKLGGLADTYRVRVGD